MWQTSVKTHKNLKNMIKKWQTSVKMTLSYKKSKNMWKKVIKNDKLN